VKAFDWDGSPPASAPLGDHEVVRRSHHLDGRWVALLVCGGIAAMKAPFVARALRARGADVVAFCSEEALRYVGVDALEWSTLHPVVSRLTWRAEHLSDAEPFDAYVVAPATYNTIGKVASGIADTVVTAALVSAIGRLRAGRTAVLVAPTMHGSMHTPILDRQVALLRGLGVRFVTPRDAYGKHNLPDEDVLVAAVVRALAVGPWVGASVRVVSGDAPEAFARAAASVEALVLAGAEVRWSPSADVPGVAPWLPRADNGAPVTWTATFHADGVDVEGPDAAAFLKAFGGG